VNAGTSLIVKLALAFYFLAQPLDLDLQVLMRGPQVMTSICRRPESSASLFFMLTRGLPGMKRLITSAYSSVLVGLIVASA